MSSVHTVQKVMSQLNPAEMSGTVMAVLDIARPAMESMQRRWPSSGRGQELTDMNREWPGNENGFSAVSRQAGLVFNRLLRPNTDLAIDFHTGTTGLDASAFHIGDMSIPDVKTMMMLYPVPADLGQRRPTLACCTTPTSMRAFPAFTPEIGVARRLDLDMIPIFVEGTMNVFKHYGVIPGTIGRTAVDANVYIGKSAVPVLITHGGFIELFVKLNDQGHPGTKGGRPAQRFRRSAGRVHQPGERPGRWPAQRRHVGARQRADVHPVRRRTGVWRSALTHE